MLTHQYTTIADDDQDPFGCGPTIEGGYSSGPFVPGSAEGNHYAWQAEQEHIALFGPMTADDIQYALDMGWTRKRFHAEQAGNAWMAKYGQQMRNGDLQRHVGNGIRRSYREHEAAKTTNVVMLPTAATKPVVQTAGNKFADEMVQDPEEAAKRPPLKYLDADQTLPLIPGDGCTVLGIAPKSNHKTGLAMMHALNLVAKGMNVLYIAVEGAHGIMTQRLPAYRTARNLSWAQLKEHWRLVKTPFHLLTDVDALVQAFGDFKPALVVLDVLGKSVSGVDFNSAQTASAIMAKADELAMKFGGATVLILSHPKRDSSTGDQSGSHMFGDLTYGEWHIKQVGDTVRVEVIKMKDGRDDFSVFYQLTPSAGETIPPIVGAKCPPPVKIIAEDQDLRRDVERLLWNNGERTTFLVKELAQSLLIASQSVPNDVVWGNQEPARQLGNEDKKLRRLVHSCSKKGGPKDGPLAHLVERDRRGDFITPYRFRLPPTWTIPADWDADEA